MTPVMDKITEYRKVRAEAEGARALLGNADAELADLAGKELPLLEVQIQRLETEIKALLLPADPNDDRNTILEIRAGTGGEEAALFAANLFRMYTRFAEVQGWKTELLDSNPTDLGGFKEVVFSIQGAHVYRKLKFEGGVHRVQRVPMTEASGRIHTSAVTVAVLPEAEEVEVEVNPADLRIDTFCAGGHGGQSVNTTYSAVRITHLPTNIVVSCQDERSQLKNKNKAMRVLRARLKEKAETEHHDRIASVRQGMVGSGDRSEKIRTYNFPQNRVTDHRIGVSWQKLDTILEGDLGQVVEALLAADQAEKLKEAS
jgi:peptide chain release factor 1